MKDLPIGGTRHVKNQKEKNAKTNRQTKRKKRYFKWWLIERDRIFRNIVKDIPIGGTKNVTNQKENLQWMQRQTERKIIFEYG